MSLLNVNTILSETEKIDWNNLDNKVTNIIIIVSVVVTILWIIGLKLSWDGGRDFYKNGSVWKIILGFFLFGGLFALVLAFLSYKKTERKARIKKEKELEEKINKKEK